MARCGAGVALAPLNRRAATGNRVSLMSVDLPEPETPVMQQRLPTGMAASTALRLLPVAPRMRNWRAGSDGVRCAGMAMRRSPER